MRLLDNTKFLSNLKEVYNQHREEILDIILFGSSVKGKDKPGDIDILVVYKDKEDLEISYKLKKMLQEYNVEVVSKTYETLISKSFKAREAYLTEGISLIRKKSIAESLGFFNGIMFKYSLKGKTKSNRMRFYYSLYGRNKNDKGIIHKYNLIKFSETILLSPVQESENIREFFKLWDIKYKEFPILMPERLKHVLG
ncbi:nucleotidyltransferase domain-containing protein [Candidatus Woesearchaeota archaeon]|nr:nucleotidyltransferase domain-containing protein [Candidatus Woesearchaeota archaeon]